MASELTSSFGTTFTTSNLHQIIFKTRTKFIGYTITKANVKQKLVFFAWQE